MQAGKQRAFPQIELRSMYITICTLSTEHVHTLWPKADANDSQHIVRVTIFADLLKNTHMCAVTARSSYLERAGYSALAHTKSCLR